MAQPNRRCELCNRLYEGEDPAICGVECSNVQQGFLNGLAPTIRSTDREDGRTFFFDASLGRLVETWAILLLKRTHCHSMDREQELDFQLHRLRKAIGTKIATRHMMPNELNAALLLAHKLLRANSRGWHLVTLANQKRIGTQERGEAALALLELSEERASLRRQLDLICGGRTWDWRY